MVTRGNLLTPLFFQIDSLPFGIEINEKPVLSTSVVTNISVSSKSLLVNRKLTHLAQSCDNISDNITLFPPLANHLQASDDSGVASMTSTTTAPTSTGSNTGCASSDSATVNYGLNNDSIYQDALINNKWLTFKSCEAGSASDG